MASPAQPAERPLRADAERNRRKILAGAAEVFADAGFDVGMDEIARRVGVGTGTLYRRFPTKEALVSALFDDLIATVVALAREAEAHEDELAGVRAFLGGMTEAAASNRGLKELMVERTRDDRRVEAARAQIEPRLERLIARGVRAGRLRAGLTHADVFLSMTMLSAVAQRTRPWAPEAWRRYLELLLEGFAPGAPALEAPALTPAQLRAVSSTGAP